jgi:hypothetical protein
VPSVEEDGEELLTWFRFRKRQSKTARTTKVMSG